MKPWEVDTKWNVNASSLILYIVSQYFYEALLLECDRPKLKSRSVSLLIKGQYTVIVDNNVSKHD